MAFAEVRWTKTVTRKWKRIKTGLQYKSQNPHQENTWLSRRAMNSSSSGWNRSSGGWNTFSCGWSTSSGGLNTSSGGWNTFSGGWTSNSSGCNTFSGGWNPSSGGWNGSSGAWNAPSVACTASSGGWWIAGPCSLAKRWARDCSASHVSDHHSNQTKAFRRWLAWRGVENNIQTQGWEWQFNATTQWMCSGHAGLPSPQ